MMMMIQRVGVRVGGSHSFQSVPKKGGYQKSESKIRIFSIQNFFHQEQISYFIYPRKHSPMRQSTYNNGQLNR